jgi:hypothetical protein
VRRYNSFLIRYWQLAAAGERVEVKHVQTDRRAVLDSLEEAMRWIAELTAAGASTRAADANPTDAAGGAGSAEEANGPSSE